MQVAGQYTDLSCHEPISTSYTVWSQSTNVTDRWTDGQTDVMLIA